MIRRKLLLGAGAVALGGGAVVAVELVRMGSAADYTEHMRTLRRQLPENPAGADLVRYAALAANGHNTQPWTFRVSPSAIEILPDFSRRTAVVDPDDHHLYASLGCALANLEIAGNASGRPGMAVFAGEGAGAARFQFSAGAGRRDALFDAIPRRQSTRGDYDGRAVTAEDLGLLARAAAVPGVNVVLITDSAAMGRVRDLVIEGNTAQMADPAFVAELKHWIRYNPRAAVQAGDGLFGGASGNPSLPTWLGPRLFDLAFTVATENDKYARHMAGSAGVAVFLADRADKEHWMRAGYACQRFALQATVLDLKHAYINQPVEVASLRPELAAIAGCAGLRPDIMVRFGYGAALPYSPRRSVATVLAR